MRFKIVLIAVLLVLAGCSGFFGSENQNPQETTSPINKSTPISTPATTATSEVFSRDLQLHRINIQESPYQNYKIVRNSTSAESDIINKTSVIRVHRSNWGPESSDSTGPNFIQSVVVLLKSDSNSSAVKETVLDTYAPDVESSAETDAVVTTRQYTTPSGLKATVATASHQNLVFYTIVLGGDKHYSDVARTNTQRLLERSKMGQTEK